MKKFYKGMCLITSIAILTSPLSVFALSKDETVYSTTNSTGKVNKTIVTEHLINDEKLNTINDLSNLNDIKNVNGDELFTKNNTILSWNAKGNDIYYQGNTNEKLPITTKVTYSLDGKEMKRKQMIGKSGHVIITIKYTNNIKSDDLYTPFVVATEMTINTKNNSNVSVSSGKVISTGTNNVIAAISTPGLYESLNLEELKNFDTVTIEYDTTKFSKTNIYSVASSKLIDNDDLSKLNNTEEIFDEINTLNNASAKLVNGSKELSDGINTLSNGTDKLSSGITTAYDGALTIKSLVDNAINNTGSNLSDDEKNLISNNATQAINTKFTDEYKNAIKSQALASIKLDQSYVNLVNNKKQLDDAGIGNLYPICTADSITPGYEDACKNNIKNISNYAAISNSINAMEKTAQETALSTAYNTAIQTASEVAVSTAQAVKSQSVDTTVNSLQALSNGLNTLVNGLYTLNTGSKSLVNGTKELQAGATTLSDSMSKFDKEGIKPIVELVNGKLKTTSTKVKQLIKLSNKYDTFTLKDNNIDGNTKFITIIK